MALQALLWLLLLQHTSACEDLACFADFVETVSCLLGSRLRPASRAAPPYSLTATWNCGEGGTCSLRPTARSASPTAEYSCFAEQAVCGAINSFQVQVWPLGDGQRSNGSAGGCPKRFWFSENVKPQPPFNVTVEASRDGYNVSWKTKYQHRWSRLDGRLQYELRYRQTGRPWQEQGPKKRLLQDTRTLQLLPHELEGGSEYEVQVRAAPGQQGQADSYQGTWSAWSPSARLRTLPREDARWLVPLLLLLSSLAVAVLFRGCHQRLWKKLDIFIPSPAPFFQPLYLAHHGDFKAWVGTSCARATLDVLEWGPILPELFHEGPKHPPPSPAKGGQALPLEPAPPHPPGHPQGPPPDGSGQAPEQSYGLLSIDTVTVAGGPDGSCAGLCAALEQWPGEAAESEGAYRGLDLDGDSSAEGLAPGGLLLQDVLLQSHSLPSSSGSLGRGSPPVPLQAGCALGSTAKDGGSVFGWPLEPWGVGGLPGLSSPDEERLFYGDLPSPDGDLGTGLDLDTIDSGFADSDCASPVDCEFEGGPSGCGAELGAGDREGVQEAQLPSYVKQWVSGHNRTLPS